MTTLTFILVVLLVVCVAFGSTKENKQQKSYNFIIVGAGSAGSILAAELAEHYPEKNVLLIEEGYYSKINPAVEDIALFNDLLADPTTQRNYKTIPKENVFNREYNLDRGKMTDDLLPLWDELAAKTYHGFVSSLGDRWMERVINASGVLGYEFNENWFDLSNGKSQEGICFSPKQSKFINNSDVARRTSWTDYIEPIIDYDNLDIMVIE